MIWEAWLVEGSAQIVLSEYFFGKIQKLKIYNFWGALYLSVTWRHQPSQKNKLWQAKSSVGVESWISELTIQLLVHRGAAVIFLIVIYYHHYVWSFWTCRPLLVLATHRSIQAFVHRWARARADRPFREEEFLREISRTKRRRLKEEAAFLLLLPCTWGGEYRVLPNICSWFLTLEA